MKKKIGIFLGGLILLPLLWCFRQYHPDEWGFFLRCDLHALTGLECPGCGGTRAAYYILNGNWVAAWHHNAFLVVSLPVMILLSALHYGGSKRFRWFNLERSVVLGLLVLLLFMVLRNIPVEPFLQWDPDHYHPINKTNDATMIEHDHGGI